MGVFDTGQASSGEYTRASLLLDYRTVYQPVHFPLPLVAYIIAITSLYIHITVTNPYSPNCQWAKNPGNPLPPRRRSCFLLSQTLLIHFSPFCQSETAITGQWGKGAAPNPMGATGPRFYLGLGISRSGIAMPRGPSIAPSDERPPCPIPAEDG